MTTLRFALLLHLLLLPLLASAKSANPYTFSFASDTPATLYLNGAPLAHLRRPGRINATPPRKPKRGDIYTILAAVPSSTSRTPRVHITCPSVRTSSQWRAVYIRPRTRVWQTRLNYPTVCTWKHAQTVGPRQLGARFIRPKGRAPRATFAVFRFAVAALDNVLCKLPAATLSIAAADRAWVFVNGHHLVDVLSRHETLHLPLRLARGDVIAVKAMDAAVPSRPHEYGLAVDLHYRNHHITTRARRGPWRMTAMYSPPAAAAKFAFLSNKFDDCTWPRPVLPKHAPKAFPKGFPAKHGAQFVWARNAQRPRTVVYARMIVGEKAGRCGQLQGQDEEKEVPKVTVKPLETCPCEMVPSAKGSMCYYFTDTRRHKCDSRQCEPMYVCTGTQMVDGNGMICVKKEIKHRVVPKEDYANDYMVCKMKSDVHHIYIPYGSTEGTQW